MFDDGCVSECSEIPAKKSRQEDRQEDGPGASYDEILEAMNYGMRKKSRKVCYPLVVCSIIFFH